jgi:transcription termination factor NusB
MKDTISIRGERELWLEFIYKAKKEKRKAWEVLSLFIRKYANTNEEKRVLLLLFPRDLANVLLQKEDPDEFIEEAIRKYLDTNK